MSIYHHQLLIGIEINFMQLYNPDTDKLLA